ncbi:MAG: hypothetical protein ACRD2Z_03390 [Thermoanaerobaculia bacterium]
MGKKIARATRLFAVACLLAAPATAEVYTVTLSNEQTVDTRYRPMIAPWDEGRVLLLTDVGNWIALPKAEIAKVRIDIEAAGYGRVIDGTTVDMGFSANDLPRADQRPSAQEQLLELVRSQQAERPVYDTPQFVDPSEASGIPVWMTNQTTPPLGIIAAEPVEPDTP